MAETARVNAGDIYLCSVCGTPGIANASHEDTRAEQAAFFLGDAATDPDIGVVCDGCWRILMTRIEAEAPELLSEEARAMVRQAPWAAGIRMRHALTGRWWA